MVPTHTAMHAKKGEHDDMFTLAMQVEKDRSLTSIYEFDNLERNIAKL